MQFSGAVAQLTKGSKVYLIELGPRLALEKLSERTCEKIKVNDSDFNYNSALVRGQEQCR